MTMLTRSKIIREYPLPCGPDLIALDLTGNWQVLRVEARFAKPNLYVLEDVSGPKSRVEFAVVNTNEGFAPELLDGKEFLGSYLVHVPTNVLHVFGPTAGEVAVRTASR